MNQDLAVVAEIIVLTIHGVAFIKRREVVPAKRLALLRVGRVPSHPHRGHVLPALRLRDGESDAQQQGQGKPDDALVGLACFHRTGGPPQRDTAQHDQHIADPKHARCRNMDPKLPHVAHDVSRGEACKEHRHGEDDEVHQHRFGSFSHLAVKAFKHAFTHDVKGILSRTYTIWTKGR